MTWKDAEKLAKTAEARTGDTPVRAPRAPGRPRGKFDPTIDWEAIENAYVWGEVVRQREDGSFVKKYPSFRDLGTKFGLRHNLIHHYAQKGNWQERRKKFEGMVREQLDQKVAESRAMATRDVLDVLDTWIVKFRDGLESGKVRTDAVSDLNTAVRLKKFLEGEPDSRAEQRHVLSLEELGARHRVMRERLAIATGPAAGELTAGGEDELPPLPDELAGDAGTGAPSVRAGEECEGVPQGAEGSSGGDAGVSPPRPSRRKAPRPAGEG